MPKAKYASRPCRILFFYVSFVVYLLPHFYYTYLIDEAFYGLFNTCF